MVSTHGIDLSADDGLDAGLLSAVVKADGAGQAVVVGERQRRHVEMCGLPHQISR